MIALNSLIDISRAEWILKKSVGEIAKEDRLKKVEKDNKDLSIKRQCELLGVCQSSFYYVPQEESSFNNELMKLIDIQYSETPFFGVLRMTNYLRELGHVVSPKRIRRLYRLMDLHAIGPRPNTSRPHKGKGHTVYPYLLRNLEITRPNQGGVWILRMCL